MDKAVHSGVPTGLHMQHTHDIDLPPGLKAFTLLAANGASMSGMRHGQSLDRLEVGRKTVVTQRSPAVIEHLKKHGLDASEEVRRTQTIKGRVNPPRRPNPGASKALQIDDRIVDLMVHAVVKEKASASLLIRKEALAEFFNVPEHFVAQSLERLNKRGLIGPEHNSPLHDSNRQNKFWGGSASGWSGSYRYANPDKLMALIQMRRATGLLPPESPEPGPAPARGRRP
jgi:hypothetical protein